MANEREDAAPLMLFDEAAAHLDKARREALFEILLSLKGQSWFTGTDSTAFASMDGKAQFFNIENAEISSAVA
jgi:DNA replication and repair protein RecF